MRLILFILLLSLNSLAAEKRTPAQFVNQIDIVIEKLKNQDKKQKIQYLQEFFEWMKTKNAEEIKFLISDTTSIEDKDKIKKNRLLYYGLEPLKEIYIDKNKLPNKDECQKLIDSVKYDNLLTQTDPQKLEEHAVKVIKLLNVTCIN